jgi:hypothetical protein
VGRDAASGLLYIALEHLRGATLAEVLSGRAMEWREALRIAAAVADALHYAHSRKIVHLDLKPANIMLLPNGQPKLMDFGIARIETARLKLTASGNFFGTPLYMSPEQALGRTLDFRTDVFSLGSVLYTLLTGRPAFAAESITRILMRVIGDDPEPPSRLIAGVPEGVDALVARALAKAPAERYAAAGLLAEDARDVLGGRPPRHAHGFKASPPPEAPPPPSPSLDSIDESELEPLLEPLLDPEEPPARGEGDGGGPREPAWVSAVAMPPTEVREDRDRQRRAARRRRRLRQAAGVAAVAVVASLLLRARGTPPAAPLETPAAAVSGARTSPVPGVVGARPATSRARAAPARLFVDFEHPLRAGQLRLWVNQDLVVDEALAGRESKKLFVKVSKGGLQQELEVAPGRHDIRVVVSWDGNEKAERIWGTFKPGETRRLEVRLGRLRKNLSVDWK